MLKRFSVGLMALVLGVAVLGAGAPVFAQDDFDYDYDYTFEDDYYTTTSTTDDLTDEEAATVLAFMGVYMFCYVVFLVIMWIVGAVVLSTLGKKVGVTEPNWMAWVPIVQIYYAVRVAGEEGWKMVLLFIPFVNIVYGIILWMKIAERRGFENWYGILVIVPVVGWLVPLYLAFAEPSGSKTPVTTTAE